MSTSTRALCLLCLLLVIGAFTSLSWAQQRRTPWGVQSTPPPPGTETPNNTPPLPGVDRRTPLGTQKPVVPETPTTTPTPTPAPTPVPGRTPRLNPETPAQTVARALAAHGAQWASGQIQDWIAEGKLTLFTADGPGSTFDMKLLRKGDRNVQRIVKQPAGELKEGSNGSQNWHSFAGLSVPAGNRILQFIESQTVRSIPSLFKYQTRASKLRDVKTTDDDRELETEDNDGRKTSYAIDAKTAAVTRLEFVTGQSTDPFSGKLVPDTERYIFSDYRRVQGLLTPFKIERFINGHKTEEMQFTSVSYNASLKDDAFRP